MRIPVVDIMNTSLPSDVVAADAVTIHTLGPEGTSSEYTARHLAERMHGTGVDVMLHRTFEDACASSIASGRDVFLVANAYPDVRRFYMDRSLAVLGCFIYQTPHYGVAIRNEAAHLPNVAPGATLHVVTHPSPVALFADLAPPELGAEHVEFHLATSTSNAAARVRGGEFDVCITNETSARLERLRFIGPMLPITMVWSLFCSRGQHERAARLFSGAVPCVNERF